MNVIDPIPAGNQKSFYYMHKRHTFIKKGFQSKKLIKLNLIELLTPSLYQVNYFSFIIKLMQIQNMRIKMMLPYY